MKINLKSITIDKEKIIVNEEEYDLNGNIIETPSEKYSKPLISGTIIDYDSEYILILENNGYVCLDYADKVNYLDYDWVEDPRSLKIYPPFKDKNEMSLWINENPHHKDSLIKYYKKSFFKNRV